MKPPETDKEIALWALENTRSGGELSSLWSAVKAEIEQFKNDDSDFQNERAMGRFALRIASGKPQIYNPSDNPVHKHRVALGRTSDVTGEWHVSRKDMDFYGVFAMWISRANRKILTFGPLRKALFQKRSWQAFERYMKTGLTREHCALLSRMLWEMDPFGNDWVSLHVQGKRPFGNSSIDIDIYEITGWPMDWGDDGMSEAQSERAWDIFDELPFAARDAAELSMERLATSQQLKRDTSP